ncbi:MAG: hypothetical protein HRT45_08385 [Bdellovibrionales bacterium]|nr:hypothetical protein [Bdellovibrionales bacterium]
MRALIKSLAYKLSLISLATLGGFAPAKESTMKILKVKGQKAVVVLPEGDFEKGDDVRIFTGFYTQSSADNGIRKYRMGFDASVGQSTIEIVPDGGDAVETTGTSFAGTVTFGFNQKQFEFGPTLTIQNSSLENDGGSLETQALALGGFFDYNFSLNDTGVMYVPYVGLKLATLQESSKADTDSGSGDSDASGFLYSLEGGLKYFPYNDQVAFTGGARYQTVDIKDSDDEQQITTDIELFAGVSLYF